MVYKLNFKKSVFRDLKRISKPEAQKLLNKIDQLLPPKANTFPALKGKFKGMRKLGVGDYRIIYVIMEEEILILRIYHRKDVYR